MKRHLLALAAITAGMTLTAPVSAEAQGLFDIFRPRPRYQPRYQPQYQPPPEIQYGGRGGRVYRDPYTGQIIIDDNTQASPDDANDPNKAAINEFRRQANVYFPMTVTKSQWSAQDEAGFESFVTSIGNGIKSKKCNTVKNCMLDARVNPFAPTDPPGLILYSDCADWPYFLRSYYAAKNGLPFSYVTGTEILKAPVASPADRDKDLETAGTHNSPYGNTITSRGGSNVPRARGQEKNYVQYLENLLDLVSTRSFRVGPLTPSAELSDVYPVRMDRYGIRSGTVVHSTGHIYIVFDVDANGTIHMTDAHPDGSVSYKIMKPSALDRSRPDQGLGFFRFRNQRVVQAQSANGALYGGRIQLESNQELIQRGLYSLEQYYGLGSNVVPGQAISQTQYRSAFNSMNFFDSLKLRLRDRNNIGQADADVRELADALCTEMKQRVDDVAKAIEKGGPGMSHPNELPANIYQTSGFWEDYSTPGRDARMKASVLDISRAAVQKFRQAKTGGFGVKYDGSAQDYQAAMKNMVASLNASCKVTYKKSNGASQTLTFNQVLSRLNKLSFDPYHCPERRWGASGEEAATCRDNDRNGAWYTAQQFMRNTVGKLNANEQLIIRSDSPISLSMLQDSNFLDNNEASPINLGTRRVPFMNLEAYFSSQDFLNALNQ
ncbi:MAG: hypothetical protein KF681_15620 [Bdellovibrionaceae bacterium]|nr:hypothetical protein [Pseudobdellovibrionaceae bacterium]